MEKPLGYTPPTEQNKKDPESLIKRVKSIVSNISRRLQKPEENSAQPVKEVNGYDRLATKEEIGSFHKEIKESVDKKAAKLNISGEKLIELTGVDLDSLEPEKLKALNLSHGNMEFIRNSIGESINEFSRSDKQNVLLKENPSRFLEFIKNNKGEISLAQLGLYLSAFGAPAIKELSGAHDIQLNIYGKEIPLEDLAKNPQLIKEIDEFHNGNTPIDILKSYQAKALEYNNTILNFNTKVDIGIENTVQKSVYFGDIGGNSESIGKLNNDLINLNLSFLYKDGGVPLEKLIKNKDKISETISSDLNIPKEVISKYIERYLMPDTSKISVVPLNEFKINKDLDSAKNSLDLTNKKAEIFQKYDVYGQGEFDGAKWLNAMNDLEKWGREKGIINSSESVDSVLDKETAKYHESPIAKFNELRNYNENFNKEKNFEKFEELFLKDIKEAGETIEHLKEIAKDNPEDVIKTISAILDKNIAYDYSESENITKKDFKTLKEKHEQGIPYSTLETNLGVCHDYAKTITAAKYVLEKNGVPNMDKLAVLYTSSDKMNHAWNNLLTVDKEGNIKMTSIDLTWADNENVSKITEELNAVNKDHYYTSPITEVDIAHQKVLKKILELNALAEEEKLREILTTLADAPRAELPKTAEKENAT